MSVTFHPIWQFTDNIAQLLVEYLKDDKNVAAAVGINIMPDSFTDTLGRSHPAVRLAFLEKSRFALVVENIGDRMSLTTYSVMLLDLKDFIQVKHPSTNTTYRVPADHPARVLNDNPNGLHLTSKIIYEFLIHGTKAGPGSVE